MKFRASTTAALSLAGIVALLIGVPYLWNESQVSGYTSKAITPGSVTLIGLDPKSGYHVIVANDVAQLAEGQARENEVSSDSAKELKRIPIREFLGTLQGKTDDLGKFVMALNELKTDELTGAVAEWKTEDIQKAIAGDPVLKPQLEKDLNMQLDGTPLQGIRMHNIMGGIVVNSPVTVHVPINGTIQPLVCRIREAFRTKFAITMETKVGEKFNPSNAEIIGMYQDLSKKVALKQAPYEDVSQSLKGLIDGQRLAAFAEKPEKILQNSTVLLNNDYITGAGYSEFTATNTNKTYGDIRLNLTHDGKMRLWKYSAHRSDFQLMFVVNDVALAAPQISGALNQDDVTIHQLPNPTLAKNAADFIAGHASKT